MTTAHCSSSPLVTSYPVPRPNGRTTLLAPAIRVLCVDDNRDAADSLSEALQLEGYETAVAYNGTAALMRAQEFQPQVCLLDITMPGMDGCELAQCLRRGPRGEELLLVALTALRMFSSLVRLANSGFDLYYSKPVPPQLLLKVLRDFAERGRPPS